MNWFVVHVFAEFVRVVAAQAVAVPIATGSSLGVATSFHSVAHAAGSPAVASEVATHVTGSQLLNIPAATVPAFIIKNFPLSTANVSVFTTTHENAGVN